MKPRLVDPETRNMGRLVHRLASNHVNALRITRGIGATYLAIFMQSIIGQLQTEQHARESAQAELYSTDIDKNFYANS